MGLSHEQHADQQRRLNPPTPTPPGPGHRRGEDVVDRTRTDSLELRGIPVVGAVTGAIIGTRPGIDNAKRIEQEQREAQALNEKARRIVQQRTSSTGILRPRRTNPYNPAQQNEDA